MNIGKNIGGVGAGLATGAYAGVNPLYEGLALAGGLAAPYVAGSIMRSPALPGSRMPMVNSLIGAWPQFSGSPPPNGLHPAVNGS
jgi:hypothetical protein